MKAVILAAGMGTRLGNLIPKPLTALWDEKAILDFMVEKLAGSIGYNNIFIVVGYKYHLIMEKFPHLMFIYNYKYTLTNTSKSLLYALDKVENEDVLWMNGDVFFEAEVLDLLLKCEDSSCLVDNKACGEEEIKYSLNTQGTVLELSKRVKNPAGEALGINLIRKKDLALFKEELKQVKDNEYFEKAIENLTTQGKLKFVPVNKDQFFCQEIDFPEDLENVKKFMLLQQN